MRLGNELKIGITIVVAVLVGFAGFRIMKDSPIFRLGTVYYVNYEKVDGLSVGTSVLVSGIKIGSVQQLQLLPSDSVRVMLNLTIPEGLPGGSMAVIRSIDLLGSKAIEIQRGLGDPIAYGGELEGSFDEGMFGDLAERGEEISSNVSASTQSLNSILSEVESMLREGLRADIEAGTGNLERATREAGDLIAESREDIASSLDNLNQMLANLEDLTSEERGEIQRTIANLEATSEELKNMSESLTTVSAQLAEILEKINNGEGTLGKLVNDPQLYNNLDSLSVNLNTLVKDLNENPRHFLRHLRLIDVF